MPTIDFIQNTHTSVYWQKKNSWLMAAPFFLLYLAVSIFPGKPVVHAYGGTLFDGDAYRQFVLGGIYLLALILVIPKLRQSVAVIRGHWGYMFLLGYILSSAIWSSFPQKVIIGWTHFVGIFLVSLCAAMAFRQREAFMMKTLLICTSIAVASSCVAALFFPARGIAEGGRWVGLTLHPNYLGIISLIAVWTSIATLHLLKGVMVKLWALLLLLLAAMCLYGSNSMTSTALSVVLIVFVPILIQLIRPNLNQTIFRISLAFMALAVFGFLAYILLPMVFSSDTYLMLMGRKSDLTGRSELWEMAKVAIDKKPIFGWSFDDLLSLFSLFHLQYGQFHNGYLDLLVRGGVVALLLFGFVTLGVIKYLFNMLRTNPRFAIIMGSFFMAFFVHNYTEATLVRAPTPLWVMFSLLYFHLGVPEKIVNEK